MLAVAHGNIEYPMLQLGFIHAITCWGISRGTQQHNERAKISFNFHGLPIRMFVWIVNLGNQICVSYIINRTLKPTELINTLCYK